MFPSTNPLLIHAVRSDKQILTFDGHGSCALLSNLNLQLHQRSPGAACSGSVVLQPEATDLVASTALTIWNGSRSQRSAFFDNILEDRNEFFSTSALMRSGRPCTLLEQLSPRNLADSHHVLPTIEVVTLLGCDSMEGLRVADVLRNEGYGVDCFEQRLL
jgi:hypothetical protein